MNPEIQRPFFARKENPAGVYKIHFGPQWYYIGSSKNIRIRIMNWITRLRSRTNKNKKIKQLYQEVPYVKFEIVEITEKGKQKEREDFHIKNKWDDPFLLNYSPNAESNFGVKHDRHGKFESIRPRQKGKKIALFTKDNIFVGHFDRICDALDVVGCGNSTFYRFWKGNHSQVKGHKFKLIDESGQYIEPTPFVSKKKPPKPTKPKGINSPAKLVIKYTKSGIEVERYKSMGEASQKNGIDRSNMRKLIKGIKKKSYHGFVYKLG